MKYFFVGGFYPKEYMSQIKKDSIGPIANANNALQWGYIEGLNSNIRTTPSSSLQLISLPQIGAFPFKYKKICFKVKNKFFGEKKLREGVCGSFLNLIVFKHISRYFSSKKLLNSMLQKADADDNIVVILYDLQVPILKSIVDIKKKFPKTRFCLIIPDLHGFTGGKKNIFNKIFELIEKYIINRCYHAVDAYVLLSKYMIEKLQIEDKPWIVIEGIYNTNDEVKIEKCNPPNNTKILFYSGALDKRNGVDNLLKAFSKINNSSFRLILCGDGDLRQEIQDAALKDTRIEYKGQLERIDVLNLQKNATLLVNPRQSSGEFTRYSFPSKTMEYYASGTPVLMYQIAGIPDEYYEYCYSPIDESVESLKKSIEEICNYKEEELIRIGRRAREFVEKQKNCNIQTEKLLNLTSKLF